MFASRKSSPKHLFQSNAVRRSLRPILVAWALVALPTQVSAQADEQCVLSAPSERALATMLQASSDVTFEGTVLFERSGSRQFLTVASTAEGNRGELRRMNAGANPRSEFWPIPSRSLTRICHVLEVYVPRLESGRIIAGRSTQRLTLRPRDTLRLTHLVDMDQSTGLPLAMITLDLDGQMLERYEYAAIEYESVIPDASVGNVVDAEYKRGRNIVPGYFLISENPDRGLFVVSDGLATASVFVEPLPAGAPVGEGAIIEGATLTYTRGVRSGSGGLLISVLGEVPFVTARLLADAVRPPLEDS
ncbi:MAG: hypothetical protein CME46_04020 [Halieaceae bacterium]|nr:hypothetical protein [Halieaceae bacterium]